MTNVQMLNAENALFSFMFFFYVFFFLEFHFSENRVFVDKMWTNKKDLSKQKIHVCMLDHGKYLYMLKKMFWVIVQAE